MTFGSASSVGCIFWDLFDFGRNQDTYNDIIILVFQFPLDSDFHLEFEQKLFDFFVFFLIDKLDSKPTFGYACSTGNVAT